jgi:hypothetical protein
MPRQFIPLAFDTSLAILHTIFIHSWPPEIPSYEFLGFFLLSVSRDV